jgi:hypothetical protein
LNHVLRRDMCPDMKIDSRRGVGDSYQFDAIDAVDYVKFESKLQHRNPKRGDICNIYVQIHDRGIKPEVKDVSIRLFYASISKNKKYPLLPTDFWTSLTTTPESDWTPIFPIRNLPEGQKTLTNIEPTVIAWQWYVPTNVKSEQIGILVVAESPEDPIPPGNRKIVDVEDLVRTERHIGLRTVTLVD